MRPELPSELDLGRYRTNNVDLNSLSVDDAKYHFEKLGKYEGRDASQGCYRELFLSEILSQESGCVLEIGPFCNPALRGPNIKYLDLYDSNKLKELAGSLGLANVSPPEHIHYVGDIDMIEQHFAGVFGSHSIEHQPDLVTHLNKVANILEPGGRYYIIAPDKRYCFDAAFPVSSLDDALTAYEERRSRHSLKNVIAHYALTVHNDPLRHWNGELGYVDAEYAYTRLAEAISEFHEDPQKYIDVHAWFFTPESFRALTGQLFQSGLTKLRPVRVYNTPFARLEFCAVLEKDD